MTNYDSLNSLLEEVRGGAIVHGGSEGLKEYMNLVYNKNKEKLIRDIAEDVFKTMKLKGAGNAQTAPLKDVVEHLKRITPDPKKGSGGFNSKTASSSKSQQSILTTLAEAINHRYKSNMINMDAEPNVMANQVSEVIHTLLNGLQVEFLTIATDVSKIVKNLTDLKELVEKSYTKQMELIRSSGDQTMVQQSNAVSDVFNVVSHEIDRQMALLANALSVSIGGPTGETIITLIQDNKDFSGMIQELKGDLGQTEFSVKLGKLLSGVSSVATTAHLVEKALKVLNMSLKEYESAKDKGDLRTKVFNIISKNKPKTSKELDKMLGAAELLYRQSNIEEIAEYLSKHSGKSSSKKHSDGSKHDKNHEKCKDCGKPGVKCDCHWTSSDSDSSSSDDDLSDLSDASVVDGGYDKDCYTGGADIKQDLDTLKGFIENAKILSDSLKKDKLNKASFSDNIRSKFVRGGDDNEKTLKDNIQKINNQTKLIFEKVKNNNAYKIILKKKQDEVNKINQEIKNLNEKIIKEEDENLLNTIRLNIEKNKLQEFTFTNLNEARENLDEILRQLRTNVQGGADDEDENLPRYWAKKSLSKKVKKKERLRKIMFEDFRKVLEDKYRQIVASASVIAENIGKSIPANANLDRFIKFFEQIPSMNVENIQYAISGYAKDVGSREKKSQFFNSFNVIMSAMEPLEKGSKGEVFRELGAHIKDLLRTIDNFSDTFLKTLSEVNIEKPEDIKREISRTVMGSAEMSKISSKRPFVQLDKIKNEMHYYYRVAHIKENLQNSAKDLEKYGEGYEDMLGEEAGWMIDHVNEYFDSLKLHYKDELKDEKVKLTNNLLILEKMRNAKVGLIKVAQAVDLYLKGFTDGFVNDPDSIQNILHMLEQVEIVAKWFNEKSGDNLATLFECFGGDAKIDGDKVNYLGKGETYFDKIEKATNLGNSNSGRKLTNEKEINAVLKLSEKSIRSMRALENILSMFHSIGNKFNGIDVSNKTFMNEGQIFNALCEYINMSSFTLDETNDEIVGGVNLFFNDKEIENLRSEPKEKVDDFILFIYENFIHNVDQYKKIEEILEKETDFENIDDETKFAIKAIRTMEYLYDNDADHPIWYNNIKEKLAKYVSKYSLIEEEKIKNKEFNINNINHLFDTYWDDIAKYFEYSSDETISNRWRGEVLVYCVNRLLKKYTSPDDFLKIKKILNDKTHKTEIFNLLDKLSYIVDYEYKEDKEPIYQYINTILENESKDYSNITLEELEKLDNFDKLADNIKNLVVNGLNNIIKNKKLNKEEVLKKFSANWKKFLDIVENGLDEEQLIKVIEKIFKKDEEEEDDEEEEEEIKEEKEKKIKCKNNLLFLSSITNNKDNSKFLTSMPEFLNFDKNKKTINYFSDIKNKINHFSDTDLLFEMIIKSIVVKVMTVIDSYRLFHRPIDEKYNKRHTNSFTPLRTILGGAEAEKPVPKVISDEDAMNLYFRLPLLAEWYRNMFGFEHAEGFKEGKPSDEFVLSVLPNMDGVWSDFNHFIYNKVYFVGENSYNESQAKELISIINNIIKLYRSRIKDCNWRQIIDSYVLDINRSYGFIKKKEVESYLTNKYKLNEYDYDENNEDIESFDILNSREQFAPINAPSDKYTTQRLNLKQKTDKLSMYVLKNKLIKFRNDIDKDFFKVDRNSSTSITYTIQNYLQELSAIENDKDKYELVLRMMQVSSKHLLHSSDKLIMLHETVAAPLNLLYHIYKLLLRFTCDINLIINYDDDIGNIYKKIQSYKKHNYQLDEFIKNIISNNRIKIDISDTNQIVTVLLKQILDITSIPNSLVTINPVNTNMNLDFNMLQEMCLALLNLVKINLNKMRILFTDKDLLSTFEQKDEAGSVAWLEEHLVEQLFKDSNGLGINQLNNKISIYLNNFITKKEKTFDLKDIYFGENNLLYKFNDALNKYLTLNQDASSTKFYMPLIENFANGAATLEFLNYKEEKGVINSVRDDYNTINKTIIHDNNTKIIQKLLNETDERTKKRKFAYESITEIPEYMKDRMRVNLTYFIKQMNIYYNISENLKRIIKTKSINLIKDDNTFNEPTTETILSRFMDFTNELKKSAENVLREISDINPLYMDLRQDFIQDYKSRNNKLPFMPLSSILLVLKNDETDKNLNNLLKQTVIGTTDYKFNRGVRLILGRDDIEPNMDHIPGVKEIYNSYSNTVNRNNILSMEEFSSMNKLIIKLVRYIGPIVRINNNEYNNYLEIKSLSNVFSEINNSTELINLTENSNLDQNKNSLANVISKTDNKGLSRKDLRINNIVDMDIVPINVHAMMREIPFVNLINYSYTFDRMIHNILYPSFDKKHKNYEMISEDTNVHTVNHLLLKLLIHPYTIIHNNVYGNNEFMSKPEYNILFRALCSGNDGLRLGRPKYLSDQLFNKSLLGLFSTNLPKFNKDKYLKLLESGPSGYNASTLINQDEYLNRKFLLAKPIESKTYGFNKYLLSKNNFSEDISFNRFNTKIVRHLVWLVNLQRIMRVMLIQHLDFISTPVINNIQIANPKVTEYEGTEEYDNDDYNGKKYGPFGDYNYVYEEKEKKVDEE